MIHPDPYHTEAFLVQACLRNDPAAQFRLYERYKRAMYTLSYRIMGNFEDAEDVLQEAFVKVFRGLSGYRGDATLGAWIKTIVVRTAYNQLKKKRLFTEDLGQVPAVGTVDWGHGLDAEYLEQAIAALPDGYRMVFTLTEIEGYTHKEVGTLLGITEGTSKSQLFHAKQRLRSVLSDLADVGRR